MLSLISNLSNTEALAFLGHQILTLGVGRSGWPQTQSASTYEPGMALNDELFYKLHL